MKLNSKPLNLPIFTLTVVHERDQVNMPYFFRKDKMKTKAKSLGDQDKESQKKFQHVELLKCVSPSFDTVLLKESDFGQIQLGITESSLLDKSLNQNAKKHSCKTREKVIKAFNECLLTMVTEVVSEFESIWEAAQDESKCSLEEERSRVEELETKLSDQMEKTKSQQLLLQALNKENEELLMKVEVVTAENKSLQQTENTTTELKCQNDSYERKIKDLEERLQKERDEAIFLSKKLKDCHDQIGQYQNKMSYLASRHQALKAEMQEKSELFSTSKEEISCLTALKEQLCCEKNALNKVVLELRDTTATLATENVTLRKENEELKLCLHENEQVHHRRVSDMEVQLTKSKRREAHLSSFVENIGASYKELERDFDSPQCLALDQNNIGVLSEDSLLSSLLMSEEMNDNSLPNVTIELLVDFIDEISPEWQLLGVKLGMEHQVKNLENTEKSPQLKCLSLLESWIDKGKGVNWKNLILALENRSLYNTAEKLLQHIYNL